MVCKKAAELSWSERSKAERKEKRRRAHSTACDLDRRCVKLVRVGRERKKLSDWKATTGRGKRRSVRVCSAKLPSTLAELKNSICTQGTSTDVQNDRTSTRAHKCRLQPPPSLHLSGGSIHFTCECEALRDSRQPRVSTRRDRCDMEPSRDYTHD